jgi:hypothetical protein
VYVAPEIVEQRILIGELEIQDVPVVALACLIGNAS